MTPSRHKNRALNATNSSTCGFPRITGWRGPNVPGTHTASFSQFVLLCACFTHYTQSEPLPNEIPGKLVLPAGPAWFWDGFVRWGVSVYLQCTVIGPSCPNCSLVLCTCPMKSMKPSPVFGTPCSGQSVNWNWRMVLDWPSWRQENKTITKKKKKRKKR